MKNMKCSWSMPNDVGAIYIEKTNKMGKGQPRYEGCENELRWKNDRQRIPLMSANRGLNNRKIVL